MSALVKIAPDLWVDPEHIESVQLGSRDGLETTVVTTTRGTYFLLPGDLVTETALALNAGVRA